MENILDKYDRELKELYGFESLPLGLKEIFKSAPQQVSIPRELLDWARQFYIEGRRSGFSPHTLENVIRTKAIEMYYSVQQIESVLEQVHLELLKRSKTANYERLKN